MRSSAGGVLTTLLLLGAVVAVPVFAVFGLPEVSEGRATSNGPSGGLKIEPVEEGRGQSADHRAADLFAGAVDENGKPRGERPRDLLATAKRDPFAEPSGATARANSARMDDWTLAEQSSKPAFRSDPSEASETNHARQSDNDDVARPRSVGSFAEYVQDRKAVPAETAAAGSRSSKPTEPKSRQGPAAPSNSWRSAVKRLSDLGIDDYRLQPGHRSGTFHFSCFASPSGNPRITHRFESEASEPLLAVSDVIRQVESWRGRQ